MSDVFRKINKEMVDHIGYRNTVMTGEITAVNDDGTYDVKIAQSNQAYPDIDTLDYNAVFSVGEIVDIAFEYGNRESPKIMGTAKKIAQEPLNIEVNYSDSTGGGVTTETVTVYSETEDGYITKTGTDYTVVHDATEGDMVYEDDDGNVFWVGILYSAGGPPGM